jgi:hypothetical protein
MNVPSDSARVPSPASRPEDDETLLLRLERLTARLADQIARRQGEDDLSVWRRAEAEVFGVTPDASE